MDLITLYFCSCDSKAQGSENFACVFGPIVYQGGTEKKKNEDSSDLDDYLTA